MKFVLFIIKLIMGKKIAKCVFVSGSIIKKDFFYFSTRLDILSDGDYDHARLNYCDMGKWNYHDRNQQVNSVCLMEPVGGESIRAYCGVERSSGIVEIYRPDGKITDEKFPGAGGGMGPMTQISQIDGALYACGADGSVFKRQANGWVDFNEGFNTKTIVDYQN